MKNAQYRKHNDGSHSSSTYHKKDGTPMRHILKSEAKQEIDETIKVQQDFIPIRQLVEFEMIKWGESENDIEHFSGEDLDTYVYAISKDDYFPAFYIWTENRVYFPCMNEMGAKWVCSAPRNPNDETRLIEV